MREIGSVLTLHCGGLGDCVLAIQAVNAMARAWGATSVTVAARSSIVFWARRHGLIADARLLDSLALHGLYGRDGVCPDQTAVFLREFDRVVSFLGGAAELISQRLRAIVGDRLMTIDPTPSGETLQLGRHITGQWLQSAGVVKESELPDLFTTHTAPRLSFGVPERFQRDLADRLRVPPSTKIAIIHPGSGGPSKCCPLDALGAMVSCLRRAGYVTALMVGPDEVERLGKPGYGGLLEAGPVLNEEEISAAADLVGGADLYIGNDSGMTHVAAWAGVRTVALFGPTDPRVWRPLGTNVFVTVFPRVGEPFQKWAEGILEKLLASGD